MSLQQKVDFLRKLIFDATGINDLVLIRRMIGRLSKYGLPKVNKFGMPMKDETTIIVGTILDQQKVSPKTAYRWLLVLKQPQEILNQINSGEISMNKAILMKREEKRTIDPEHEKLGKEILSDMIKLVGEI